MKQRRKLTIEELKGLPRELWNLELIQIETDAILNGEIAVAELAQDLRTRFDTTAEMIVELRDQLNVEPVPQDPAA